MIDLIHYCTSHMCSKELLISLLNEKKVQFKKSDNTFKKLSSKITPVSGITIEDIRLLFRKEWKPSPVKLHIDNLKSGVLNGHDWHGAMPSMLHLSMQNQVRDCIDGNLSLQRLIDIGSDIMKHEYFIVATHDLCETTIIEKVTDTIPSVGNKSISDFVFKNIPYDLKNTNPIDDMTKEEINSNKEFVIKRLLAGADVARIREQAQKTINNWGLNRFYFIVENQERWLKEPETILEELVRGCKGLGAPIETDMGGVKIQTQLIAV